MAHVELGFCFWFVFCRRASDPLQRLQPSATNAGGVNSRHLLLSVLALGTWGQGAAWPGDHGFRTADVLLRPHREEPVREPIGS